MEDDEYDIDNFDETEFEEEQHVPQTKEIRICVKCNRPCDEVGNYVNNLEKENEELKLTLDSLIASLKKVTNDKNEENQQLVPIITSQALTIVDPTSDITHQISYMRHCWQMNMLDKDYKIELLQKSHELDIEKIKQQNKQKEEITQLRHILEITKLEAQLQILNTRLSLSGISDTSGSLLMDQTHYVTLKGWLKNSNKLSLLYRSGNGPFRIFNAKGCVILLKSDGFIFGGTRKFLFTLTNPHFMEPTKFKAKHNTAYLKVTMNMLVWGSDVVIDCDSWKGKVSFPISYKDRKQEGKGCLTFCGQTEFDVQEMEVWLLGS